MATAKGAKMYENTEKFVDIDFEQKVRQAAYHLWEADGRPFGKETDYWFAALQKLLAERDEPKGDKLLKN
jgi:hypothetical protein